MKLSCASVVLGLLSLTPALARAQDSQRPRRIANADTSRQQAVKDEFLRNYRAYTKYASGYDKLSPVRQGGYDDDMLSGFQGSLVESLSTMIVMGMGDSPEYKQMLEAVKKIDFTTTKKGNPVGVVSIFELTIHYIGGLLSAYQLNGERKEEYFLVEQAQKLADGLIVGWYGTNKLPFNWVNINQKKPNDITNMANLAEAGSLTMEWGMLSHYTKDPKYAKLAQGSVDAIISTPGYFPSVWPSFIHPDSLKPASTYITTGGTTDTFIEYLSKFPVLLDNPDHQYAQTYGKMIDTLRKELVSKTSTKNLTFIADYNIDKKEPAYVGSHLGCFIGGNLAYAGRLYKRDEWTQLGLEITESCYETYRAQATGVGPYSIGWFDRSGKALGWEKIPTGRREFANEHGFFTHVTQWLHSAEIMESLFYAHHITGKPMFRDMAWEGFQAVLKYADAGIAIAGIQNVNDLNTLLYDQTETPLFSGFLKYLYLIFSDAEDYSLDEYVFSTDGHLFRRGSGVLPAAKSKRAANAASSKSVAALNSKWGKVQDHPFNYTSIINPIPLKENAGALSAMKVTTESVNGAVNEYKPKEGDIKIDVHEGQESKQGVFFAASGASKQELTESTMSLLGINKDVAKGLLSKCADDNAKLVKPNGKKTVYTTANDKGVVQ